MNSLTLIIFVIFLSFAAIALAVYWIINPHEPIEPWIIIASTLAGITEVFRRQGLPNKTYFPDTIEEFYNYYSIQTDEAKEEIWLTTDGYNMKNPSSKRYGLQMLEARSRALSRGVNLHWFQVTCTMHINWIDQLLELKRNFSGNFHIHVNHTLTNVPNVCAIDPDLKTNISESMEHRTGMFGQGSEAVSAAFVHRDLKKAKRTKQIVQELIESPFTKELDEKGLENLKDSLCEERINMLIQWRDNHLSSEFPDVSESGVFDELVISKYIELSTKST